MDNSMDKYLGKRFDRRYELVEIIGTGGMAIVYKGFDHRLNRYVAIKVLREDLAVDDEFRKRFETESKAAGMLSHPNIVSIYDVSRGRNPEYIVMELVSGVTLKQYMTTKGSLRWQEVLHFSTQIAKALSHAHSRGIVHRDIKPHNIMLAEDGSLKVADFGIARLENTQNTLTTQALGSVHYISPEQAKGERVDSRSDIYSLGVVMYEMLTGKLPFDGDSPVAIAVQHINSAPASPRSINPVMPEKLEDITMKAMNPDVEMRYQTADELLEDLESFRNSSSQQTKDESVTVRQPMSPQARELPDDEFRELVIRDVKPVSRAGERGYDGYVRRRSRSRKVSMLTGFFIVLIFMSALGAFLWSYFLKDMFEDGVRINMPNFVGDYWDDIKDNEEFGELFNFVVTYAPNADKEKGIITAQDPAPEKSILATANGISVSLTVSSGIEMVKVPDVYNKEYRTATEQLKNAGFVVETEYVESETVTQNYIVSTSPEAGESLTIGSTVYLRISGGPTLESFDMPNLVGMTQAQAEASIESHRLTLGSVSPVNSDEYPVGVVIWQSIEKDTEVTVHTKVYIQVSSGPAATAPPEETDPPEEPTNNPPPPTPGGGETPPDPEPPADGGEGE